LPLQACQPEICRIQPAEVSRNRYRQEGAPWCAAVRGANPPEPGTHPAGREHRDARQFVGL